MTNLSKPKFGSAVPPHQDSTFLHTTPKNTLLGFWLALEDATEDNGCLWSVPGSHKKFKNVPNEHNPDLAYMFRTPDGGTEFRDGRKDEYFKSEDFNWVPHQARKGDLVLIHGQVFHKDWFSKSKSQFLPRFYAKILNMGQKIEKSP